MILVGIGILLLGGGLLAGIKSINNSQTHNTIPTPTQTINIDENTPYTIIYGYWSGNNSILKSYNLENNQNYPLATLPQNIKRITAFMPDTLYYINNTDSNDHGTEIVK